MIALRPALRDDQGMTRKDGDRRRSNIWLYLGFFVPVGLGLLALALGPRVLSGKASGDGQGCGGVEPDDHLGSQNQALGGVGGKNILFLSDNIAGTRLRLPEKVQTELKERGYSISWQNDWETVALKDTAGQYKYHLVVMYSMNLSGVDPSKPKFLEDLHDFVKAGGGLLLTLDNYPIKASIDTWNAVLEKFDDPTTKDGARYAKEGVCEFDKANFYAQTLDSKYPYSTNKLAYSWTDHFNPNLITKSTNAVGTGQPAKSVATLLSGEGLYYPTFFVNAQEPMTLTLDVKSPWQWLAKGSSTSYAFDPKGIAVGSNDHRDCLKLPKVANKKEPVIAAVLDLFSTAKGGGRVAAWPMHPALTFFDGYSPLAQGGVVMDTSGGCKALGCTRESKGALLLFQTFDWLSHPALEASKAALDPKFTQTAFSESVVVSPPVARNWSSPVSDFKLHAYMGFIGARSDLDPERQQKFIDAAAAAGYQFIVFAEDVDSITDLGKWKNFVQNCAKLKPSQPQFNGMEFLAIPGVFYRDGAPSDPASQTEFLAIGLEGYPKLYITGKRHPNYELYKGPAKKPAIVMLPQDPQLPNRDRLLLSAFKPAFHGYALQVTEPGERMAVEWDQQTYLDLQRKHRRLFPTVVHKTDDPDALAGIAQGPFGQAFVRADSLGQIVANLSATSLRRAGFVSTTKGPRIKAVNALYGRNANLSVKGYERIRLDLSAEAIGNRLIQSVEVFDNGHLYRRFQPQKAQWTKSVYDYHDKQHSFVMVVSDDQGGRAISWDSDTFALQYSHYMQRDGLNEMTSNWGDADSGKIFLAGTEIAHNPMPEARFRPFPLTNLPNPSQSTKRFASMSTCDLVSRFGKICRWPLSHFKTQGITSEPGNPQFGLTGPTRNPQFDGELVVTRFIRRPPGPSIDLYRYNIVIKKNEVTKASTVTFNDRPGLVLAYFETPVAGAGIVNTYLAPTLPSGMATAPVAASTQFGILKSPGDAVGVLPMLGAAFALSKDLRYKIWNSNTPILRLGLGDFGYVASAGQEFHAEFAVARLPAALNGNYGTGQSAINPFAYQNNTGAPHIANRTNSINALAGLKTHFKKYPAGHLRFDANAEQKHGLLEPFDQSGLPVAVVVENLNPNWSAAVWYLGQGDHLRTQSPAVNNKFVVVDQAVEDKYIPLGVSPPSDDPDQAQGVALLQLDLASGPRDVFIGNVVTCSDPNIRLTYHPHCPTPIKTIGTNPRCVEVHNPGTKTATIKIELHPAIASRVDPFDTALTLAAGSSDYAY